MTLAPTDCISLISQQGENRKATKMVRRLFLLTLLISIVHRSGSLTCSSSKKDFSFCRLGGRTTIFGQNNFSWALRTQNISSLSRHSDTDKQRCKSVDINACEGYNNTENEAYILQILEEEYFVPCLNRYCRSVKLGTCFFENTTLANQDVFQVEVTINENIFIPSCLIELNEIGSGEKTVDFVCKWSRLNMAGVNASLTISNIQTHEDNNYCANNIGMVKTKKLLPYAFLNMDEEANAYCTLSVPNLPSQPSCNFSLYISPRIGNVTVGERINLTCPYNASKWSAIGRDRISDIDYSVKYLSQTVVEFHSNTPYEDGCTVVCSTEDSDGKLSLLGIGKIYVRNNPVSGSTTKYIAKEDNSTDLSSLTSDTLNSSSTLPTSYSTASRVFATNPLVDTDYHSSNQPADGLIFKNNEDKIADASTIVSVSHDKSDNEHESNTDSGDRNNMPSLTFTLIALLGLALIFAVGSCIFFVVWMTRRQAKARDLRHQSGYNNTEADSGTEHIVLTNLRARPFTESTVINERCSQEDCIPPEPAMQKLIAHIRERWSKCRHTSPECAEDESRPGQTLAGVHSDSLIHTYFYMENVDYQEIEPTKEQSHHMATSSPAQQYLKKGEAVPQPYQLPPGDDLDRVYEEPRFASNTVYTNEFSAVSSSGGSWKSPLSVHVFPPMPPLPLSHHYFSEADLLETI